MSESAAEISALAAGVMLASIMAIGTTPWFRSQFHVDTVLMTRVHVASVICSAEADLRQEDFMACDNRLSNGVLWAGDLR